MDALWPKLLLWAVVLGARSAVIVSGAALDADICDEASLLANPGHLRPHLHPAARLGSWEDDTGRPTAPPLDLSLPLGGQPSGAEERSEHAGDHTRWAAAGPTDCMAVGEQGCMMNSQCCSGR
eukprot:CAMPEP_0183394028 /NCGR_PEP_ID=MMETSP0370-20130417/8281_1 /TAXON_ID=268820 /ORGANISM="Peridinium aciculiferum, Strain PAER-2" /LENGTH=122 /DNA_ID=CAMNT_0025574319 /DNA_START=19 /DNA_END=383 /DNA_ORIENTATION=+